MPLRLSRLFFLCGLSVVIVGCAVLTRPPRHRTSLSGSTSAPTLNDGYEDYVGALHIHTAPYSHDAHGEFEDVVRVANAQSLDYVILTEHNNLQALRDGKQGWHGATLVLIGVELSTQGGHYLAFNVTEEIDRSKLTTQQIINEVNRQGGLGFIAHPYFKKARWRDWSVKGFTGIEAYNVAHDTLDENRLRLVFWTLTAPVEPFYLSLLDRPYDPLAKWDELIHQHERVVGIGATDAHEFHALGLKFAPYEIMFQLIRTHVLIASKMLTKEDLYDALRQGHAYLGIELLESAKGFSFLAALHEQVLAIMGDQVALAEDLVLKVETPAPAQLSLYWNGQRYAAATGQTWEIPINLPGAYRLEATRHGKPWIISNPIYVYQASDAAEHSVPPS